MSGGEDVEIPSDDEMKKMSKEELTRLGAALDGVELVEYGERYVPGSPADRRAERNVAKWFVLTAIFGVAAAALFVFWPAGYQTAYSGSSQTLYGLYTPLVGATLGASVLFFGIGVIALAKKIAPHEVAVQQRHVGMSDEVDRQTLGAEMVDTVDKMGMVKRRGVLKGSLVLAGGALGLATLIPILGGFIKSPWSKGADSDLWVTLWKPVVLPDKTTQKVRLTQIDGTPVRPADVSAGGIVTVFPGVDGGAKSSDSAVLLFRLRSDSNVMIRNGQDGFEYGDYYAYSKICTHVGCPASLYEQQTGRILCPCHQSQFDVFDGAKPVFGPATRPLPQLPIELDAQGYFVARSDFIEPVGPGFWESNAGSTKWGSHPKGSKA
ncbi:ubiquinol-cytochrome c reductase iron-sulfur subunit [Nakamurella sp. UYEF19]|uniref:cytochrome bc1 complex Rieske iron-sulfur subunit n=1 Tax=Nakamurella sp. UYEF19 TaxID=1756392 RepID=UPI003392376B